MISLLYVWKLKSKTHISKEYCYLQEIYIRIKNKELLSCRIKNNYNLLFTILQKNKTLYKLFNIKNSKNLYTLL
jgi:hypothetical protein